MSLFKITQIGNKVVGVEKLPPQKFQDDDWVVLWDQNPFKGTLRARVPYRVRRAYPKHITIMSDNGTEGTYADKWFRPYMHGGLEDGAVEYEQAMKAKDIMEGL